MQTLSTNLSNALNIDATVDPRILVDLYEFYAHDYVPGVGTIGFNPADAVEKFAAETISWNGIAYRREAISRGDISKNMGEKTNSVTLTLSNVSRYTATWAQLTEIEGLFCVIRCICPSVTDDSLVLFVGRCDKPSDIDKKTFSLSARQDFGNINQSLPPDRFLADDPEGRLPSDPLFEGIPFIAIAGSNTFPSVVPTDSRIGRLFGRRRVTYTTNQWSSLDLTPYGTVVPEVFGRAQMSLIPFAGADKGLFLTYLMAACKGPIDAISNIKTRTDGFSDPFNLPGNIPAVVHLGDLGGTGTNLGNTNQADLGGGSKFSHLAYIEGASTGSAADQTDGPPNVTALIRGRKVPLPNTSGVYGTAAWTDNPVHIARFVLTSPKWVNIDPLFMEDAVNYQTGLHCDTPLIDNTGDQIIVIPSTDLAEAGTSFTRYRSTGLYTPRYFLYNSLGDLSIIPEFQDGPYYGIVGGAPPPDPSDPADPTYTTQKPLRKRYTFNAPLTDEVRAVDFLDKTVFPTAKLYMRVNKYGRYEIRSEQPSDSTRLRTATSVGATSIPVLNVTPWKSGPDLLLGRIVLGFDIITSEVRTPSAAVYSTSGNSITLTTAVTGSVTATASGATLTGGSTSVQASGTVTIGGTATGTVRITIDGIPVDYALSGDTTSTTAAMLTAYINANQRLNKYILASWLPGSPTIVTIKCLHGALTVPALLQAHTTAIADPITAPTCAAASGGSLAAGTYLVAYADVNANGATVLTTSASIVVTLNQKINISGLPALVGLSRDFYMSEKAGSTNLRYVTSRFDAANFSILTAPLPGAALPPSWNQTAEEMIRIAMSFATNSQDVYSAWQPSSVYLITGSLPDDTYLPTVLNGHKYQLTTAGTTGSTEPTWPLTAGGTVASGSAVFTEIGPTVLGQAGLTRANVIKDSFKWPKGSTQSSVNQVKGSYRDAKNDFALTPVRVNDPIHQLQVKKIYPLEFDASAIDNFNQFSRIANFLLSKNREGDWFNAVATGPQGLVLEEGDLICTSDDSGGIINVVTRIEDLRISPNHDVTINQARKYSTLMFSDDVGSHRIPLPSNLRYVATKDSLIQFIDTYPIRASDAVVPGFKVSVSQDLAIAGDWRGWALWADYGDGYTHLVDGDVAATLGTCTTTLAAVTDTSILDTTHSITFTLKYGQTVPFGNIPSADLLDNPYRNLFLIAGEYVQAATVVDNGSRSFTLSNLWRGRFYTDRPLVAHGAGERVIFIDGAEVFVPCDVSRLNLPFNYKVVTTNQDVSDASPVSFTWTGQSLRPAPPTNLTSVVDPSFNWHIRCVSHATQAQEPADFIARVRRYSDSVLMRDLPMNEDSATSFAGVFSDVSGGGYSIDNNLYAGTSTVAENDITYARSSQEITDSDVVVEWTGTFDYTQSTLIHSITSQVALIPSSLSPWEQAGFGGAYYVALLWNGNADRTIAELNVLELDPVSGFLVSIGNIPAVPLPAKIRMALVGTQIRFSVNWINQASIPVAVGTHQLVFPLRLRATVFGANEIHNLRIAGLTDPQTIYAANQQAQDSVANGGPDAPLPDITIEAWQTTPYPGIKGIPTLVTRFNYGTPSPPADPTLLTAMAIGIPVNLSWVDNASNETGFKIERKSTGAFAQIGTTGVGGTAYTDSSGVTDTLYTYRVRAYNAGGNSGYTNEATATTFGGATPANLLLETGGDLLQENGAQILLA